MVINNLELLKFMIDNRLQQSVELEIIVELGGDRGDDNHVRKRSFGIGQNFPNRVHRVTEEGLAGGIERGDGEGERQRKITKNQRRKERKIEEGKKEKSRVRKPKIFLGFFRTF